MDRGAIDLCVVALDVCPRQSGRQHQRSSARRQQWAGGIELHSLHRDGVGYTSGRLTTGIAMPKIKLHSFAREINYGTDR